MGEPDVARVDVAALFGVARQYEAVADIVDGAVRSHLTGLAFDGATAGRMHVARGDALRDAVDTSWINCASGRGRPPRSPRHCAHPRTAMPKPTPRRPTGGVAVAEKLDAASRLAEGRPSVDNVQNYVWACHLLGYQDPDLTLHASQVRDWYGSEDGLDLRGAGRRLRRAASARWRRRRMRWPGRTTSSPRCPARGRGAVRRRHESSCAATAKPRPSAAAAVRTAADALAALRDSLWHAVDGKVAAALAIDDRGKRSAPSGWPPRRR